MSLEQLKRVVVIGTRCSGKTTFACQLARLMQAKHIELDTLIFLPNWKLRPREDFKRLVSEALAADQWVLDGNSKETRDIVWSRATTLIWLKFPWHVVLCRALRRFKKRVIDKQMFHSGNYGTFCHGVQKFGCTLFWVKTFRLKKRYARLLKEYQKQQLQTFVFSTPQVADRFLAQVEHLTELCHA